ncbi:MAG: hypothetical protein JWP08_2842 [Bryobacterales bacterium]|nr:hypothetical protein [Bryobacterales bacterium]
MVRLLLVEMLGSTGNERLDKGFEIRQLLWISENGERTLVPSGL